VARVKFEAAREIVGATPYLAPDEGRVLYDHILKTAPRDCLELGHAHGVSTIYMAAALHELGRGRIDTVDLETAVEREPNLETLLKGSELAPLVRIYREKNSYNWFLKTRIERHSENGHCVPCYDFCFFDGAKNWTIDGLAFFLVDKLLRPDGWLLFDDLKWFYGKVRGREASDGVTLRSLSEAEINEPHVEAIFRTLVMQHPDYGNFEIQDDWWAWAQKSGADKALKITERRSAG
jgi:predicted O-methyltransferase YrrM